MYELDVLASGHPLGEEEEEGTGLAHARRHPVLRQVGRSVVILSEKAEGSDQMCARVHAVSCSPTQQTRASLARGR